MLPRTCLLTIHKAYVKTHLGYADSDKPDSESINDWLEKIQYNAVLEITGTIRGISRDLIYNELSLEYLADRRWYRKMTEKCCS